MEELLNQVTQKTGLPLDQARSAVAAVLAFIRGKLPEQTAGKFETALSGLGQKGPLPAPAPDVNALAEKTGLGAGQVGALLESVMTFLKDKLQPDLVTSITSAVSKGGLGAMAQKLAGMFGKG
jgi:hypothetical protein